MGIDVYKTDPYRRQLQAMKAERLTFEAHWKECSQFYAPRRGRFFVEDRNKGDKRYNAIINSAGTQALRVARAGMLAGTMSPARPWFNLETPDPEMMEFQPVKEWLFLVEQQMRDIFSQSNFYGMASVLIGELLQFGTGYISQIEDFNDVVRFYTHTIGSYWFAQNSRFEVTTAAREFEWTVEQVVDAFGLSNVSRQTKEKWDRGDYHLWVRVCHFISPNRDYNVGRPLSKYKQFKSCYFEADNADKNQFLSEKGFNEFPGAGPRWDVTGEDIYGTDCPAMTALGDIKGLQVQEKRKAQALDKMTNPTLRGPATLRNVPITALPGGVNIYEGDVNNKLEPVHVPQVRFQEIRIDNAEIERRIKAAFFNDMFLAALQIEGIQPRNQLDLTLRNEERLLQIGPVLEHLHGEFLGPVINRTFNMMARAGILPPPPAELQGQDLKIKFISTLAMAQRAVATSGLDRLGNTVIALTTAGFAAASQKLDAAQFVDEYGKALGVPPNVIKSDEIVAQEQAEAARQAQEERALQMAQGMAGTAKDMAAAKTNEPNALTALTEQQ